MDTRSDGCTPMTPEELQRALDVQWAWRDRDLQEQYPDQFVAVYRRQVVAHGDDYAKVLEEAERVTGQPRDKFAVTTVLGPETLFVGH